MLNVRLVRLNLICRLHECLCSGRQGDRQCPSLALGRATARLDLAQNELHCVIRYAVAARTMKKPMTDTDVRNKWWVVYKRVMENRYDLPTLSRPVDFRGRTMKL